MTTVPPLIDKRTPVKSPCHLSVDTETYGGVEVDDDDVDSEDEDDEEEDGGTRGGLGGGGGWDKVDFDRLVSLLARSKRKQ